MRRIDGYCILMGLVLAVSAAGPALPQAKEGRLSGLKLSGNQVRDRRDADPPHRKPPCTGTRVPAFGHTAPCDSNPEESPATRPWM